MMIACVFQYYCSASHVHASTSFQQEEFSFTWHINEAKLFLRDSFQKIRSPAFTVPRIPCNFFLNASMSSVLHLLKSDGPGWYELSLQLECEKDTLLINASIGSSMRVFQSSIYEVLASKCSFSVWII